MSMTVQDATKDELIQYFFNPLAGGFRIPADKDRFLIWLQQKRDGELLSVIEQSAEASQKALHAYIEYVKQANNEKDIERKLELFEKANESYKRYEKLEKAYEKANKKLEKGWKC